MEGLKSGALARMKSGALRARPSAGRNGGTEVWCTEGTFLSAGRNGCVEQVMNLEPAPHLYIDVLLKKTTLLVETLQG